MSAALDIFAERGFDAASLLDIAERAGAPKATLLYYFKTKEEIWKAAVDAHWAEVDRYFTQHLPRDLPVSRAGIETMLRVFFQACQMFTGYTRIPALEGAAQNWRSAWLADRHLKGHVDVFRNYMAAMVRAGVIKPVDPLTLQVMVGGLGHVYFGQMSMWTSVDHNPAPPDAAAKRFIDDLLMLLCVEPKERDSF